MSVWVSESELASRLGYKILIAGLSEAGKTAVKRIFFMKQKTDDVDALSATINYERMAIPISGVPITIVDLGGQRVFIKRFLGNFSPFIFSAVKIFIYLIDVAAKSTRNNSIEYFKACIEKLQAYSPDADFFVFLHKNDLVRDLPNYESIHTQLKEQFQQESSKKIHFLRTTIYRPETVIDAFGRIFEISIPRIAQSEYVDGRIIGQVEEHAEEFFTVRMKTETCPVCANIMTQDGMELRCNACGHTKSPEPIPTESVTQEMSVTAGYERTKSGSEVLEKLTALMKDAVVEDGGTSDFSSTSSQSAASSTATNDKDSLDVLKALLQDAVIKENTVEDETAPSDEISAAQEVMIRINYLKNFYGIKDTDAKTLIELNQDQMFERVAMAGVPIKLILTVLQKYIPYLEKKGIEVETLDTRLMEVFFAYLNKLVLEDELFECLIFVAQRPNIPVEEIVRKYLVKIRQEKKRKLREEEEKRRKEKPEPEPEEVTPPDELAKDIIALSTTKQIGFTAKREELNWRLDFYHGKNLLTSNLVPFTISILELKYLLAFEAELPAAVNNKEFVEMAAPIIHQTLKKYKQKKIDKGKVEIQSPLIPLLIGQDILYKIEMREKGFQITFTKKEQIVGQIEVPITIIAPKLLETIKTETMIPVLLSEDDLIFAAQSVFSTTQILKKKIDSELRGELEDYIEQLEED
ncbi:MAG: ADP-ribosylation factor-like protein [Candidatus Hermodarchaeota archaeon]